ncbi:transcriptional regulator GlxA family with amidase domain [Nocardiopsis mwathae]|uniref:Transcriptional regulator GlxA family with amidase domain n=1 Tax=Nocardiopsis mwathae TaxID=1472723 RepID=A0A7W9YHK5_9ACTN|nr:helix-turn-helix domain-containing protein [Nocardiopsis mwathae]MBB6172095.1 transcriptional regulator GlxA family with amidase domain [Nocardiopsis mwathae]
MDARSVVVVGYAGAELLDIAAITTSLEMANRIGRPDAPYRISVAAPGGRPIACASGLVLRAQLPLTAALGPLDTLVVSGGPGHARAAADPVIVGHVRRLAGQSRRVSSVCTGASLLAAAGLLDGRRATTHWQYADHLAAEYPAVTVDAEPIYIRDGNVSTAAGVTSALDLMLAFIEEDHGAELAREVARALVTYLQRPGDQAQISMFTAAPHAEHDLVRRVAGYIGAHLDGDLTTAALAKVAGVSPRHLTRLFLAHLGHPPGRFVRRARTEAAARLLSTTALPVARVAARCGFGSAESLRQAFVRHYGVPPSEHRAADGRVSPR